MGRLKGALAALSDQQQEATWGGVVTAQHMSIFLLSSFVSPPKSEWAAKASLLRCKLLAVQKKYRR